MEAFHPGCMCVPKRPCNSYVSGFALVLLVVVVMSSALGMELGLRAADAIRKKNALKLEEKVQLPILLAEAWERDKKNALARADAGQTNFTWAFDDWFQFQHFSPTCKDINDALPQEIKNLRDHKEDRTSVTVQFDPPYTFNIVIDYDYLTARLFDKE